VRVTIQVRTEEYAFFGDFSKSVEAENLEAARIGKDRPRPGHELMESTERPHGFVAGSKKEVISVAENYFRVEVFQ
jgi:hypothetical protein